MMGNSRIATRRSSNSGLFIEILKGDNKNFELPSNWSLQPPHSPFKLERWILWRGLAVFLFGDKVEINGDRVSNIEQILGACFQAADKLF